MSLRLHSLDLSILALYVIAVFGIGIALSKRASRNTEEFFVSGRSLPWWIVGTSMVATTFAADTPLVVSGLVAQGGIYKNWLWWQWGIGGITAVFLFAPLWNRARITTDAELIEIRYDGKPAAALRFYRAVWFGLFQNVLVIAWVMKAMVKIIIVVMGWEGTALILGMRAEIFTVLLLFVVAVTYTALSGLWGVVITDFLQFILAMGGAVYLAIAAVVRLGGIAGIRERFAETGFSFEETTRIIPRIASLTEVNPFTEFLILIGVVWWAAYQFDGGGYFAQRLFAAKNERHSVLGYLWCSVAHIALRPWPWIIVGLCGIAMFGVVDDPETYYPMVMRSILPAGVLGLVIASFFAAFMSTVDTQLNWGASLLVNDIFRRFLMKGRTEKLYLRLARGSVLILAVFGAIASFAVNDISFAWKLVISVTAGIGTVYIGRWYWWRVNAWSEITAMATAFICTLVFTFLSKSARFGGNALFEFPFSVAITVVISLPAWISVTLLTRPVTMEHLVRFYRRVRPGGPGWKRVYSSLPGCKPPRSGSRTFVRIVSGVISLNAILVGIGKLVLGDVLVGGAILTVALIAGSIFVISLRSGISGGECV